MTNFFPSLLIIAGFFGMLAGMLGFDIVQSKVNTANIVSRYQDYDREFNRLELESIFTQEHIKVSQINAPVVIINFWATWCGPCIEEFSSLSRLIKMYPSDQVAVVEINSDEGGNEAEIMSNIRSIKDKYFSRETIFVRDKEGDLARKFKVSLIPYTIIFSKGRAELVHSEKLNFDSKKVHSIIRRALN